MKSPSAPPLAMPTSSSLLLAASAKRVPNEAPIEKKEVSSSGAVNNGNTNGRRSLSSKFRQVQVDPREELLNSIRGFANGGGLKKVISLQLFVLD